MKSKHGVTVKSLPRSGTHYLASLIALNLFPDIDSQEKLLKKRAHGFPSHNESDFIVYVYRDYEDWEDAIFRWQKMLCLNISKKEELRTVPVAKFFKIENKKMSFKFVNCYGRITKKINRPFNHFHPRNNSRIKKMMTLYEYHREHYTQWQKHADLVVKFSDLLSSKEYRLLVINDIAKGLGRKKVEEIIEVPYKVGWI